jgi:hypothetical protein
MLYHLDELHYISLPDFFAKMDLRHGNIGGIHHVNEPRNANSIHRDSIVQRLLFWCYHRQTTASFDDVGEYIGGS